VHIGFREVQVVGAGGVGAPPVPAKTADAPPAPAKTTGAPPAPAKSRT